MRRADPIHISSQKQGTAAWAAVPLHDSVLDFISLQPLQRSYPEPAERWRWEEPSGS